MTTITLETSQVTHALNQLSQRITNMQPAMASIGESVASWVDLTFRDAQDPYGNPWADLSPVTIAKRRDGSAKPLNDTGALKASITKNASQFEVTIGTNEDYSPTHQFGAAKGEYATGVPWGDIPARPFLPTESGGLPNPWEQDILTIIRHHLEAGI
jgi:phage virion morphogenesis protein